MENDLRDGALEVAIERYAAGDATDEQVELVRGWLAEDPSRERILDDVRHIHDVAARRPPARPAAEALRRQHEQRRQAPQPKRRVAAGRVPRWNYGIAAAAVVVLAIGALALPSLRGGSKNPQTSVTN